LLVVGVFSLRATYFDPNRQRPDVRSVAAYLVANERPSDVIVLFERSPVARVRVLLPWNKSNRADAGGRHAARTVAARLRRGAAIGEHRTRKLEALAGVVASRTGDPTDVVKSELMTKAQRMGVGPGFSGHGAVAVRSARFT